MMVRGPGLAESMSQYLIDRIAATSNIELMTETEIVALDGPAGAGLEQVRWRDRRAGRELEAPIRNVFLFVGADPATEWLKGCGVALDKAGFVMTGTPRNERRPRDLGARILDSRRVCGGRRTVRFGEAGRRGDRRRRAGGGGDPQFPRPLSRSPPLTRSGEPTMSKTCTHLNDNSRRDAERARLRGLPQDRRCLASSAALPHLRTRRMLRPVAEPARDQAFSRHPPSDHRRLRSARRLGMVLRRRSDVRSLRPQDAPQRPDPALLLTRTGPASTSS